MWHIRVDNEELNSKRRFACGLGPNLPEGDKYVFESEVHWHDRVDCPGCNPAGPRQIGAPISKLSGRPSQPGYAEFARIAKSWGYE